MSRHRARPPWSWPGAVALLLAGALGSGWAAALVIAAVHPQPTSDAGLNMLAALGQTMAGAVAAYLGYQLGSSRGASSEHGTTQDEPLIEQASPGRDEADL